MTLTDLVQFYAPLAGLLVVVFWLGRLSEKVSRMEKAREEDKSRFANIESDIEDCKNDGGGAAMAQRMVAVETLLAVYNTTNERHGRALEGIQRTLANLTSGKGGFTIIREDDKP